MLYYAKLNPIFSQLASFYFWLPYSPKKRLTFNLYKNLGALIIRWNQRTDFIRVSYIHTHPNADLCAQLNRLYTAQLLSHYSHHSQWRRCHFQLESTKPTRRTQWPSEIYNCTTKKIKLRWILPFSELIILWHTFFKLRSSIIFEG